MHPLLLEEPNELMPWFSIFGSGCGRFGEAFKCRVYDRKVLTDGDVIRDFWDVAGLDPALILSVTDSDNFSISAETVSVFLRIPPRDARTPEEAKVIATLVPSSRQRLRRLVAS